MLTPPRFEIQSNLRLRPRLVSDHLSSATPPFVNDRDHF